MVWVDDLNLRNEKNDAKFALMISSYLRFFVITYLAGRKNVASFGEWIYWEGSV